MKPGDIVELLGKDGSVSRVNYRGKLDSNTAIVVDERGCQWSFPLSQLRAVPVPVPAIAVGDMVAVKGGEYGLVVDIQGMFYIVEVDEKPYHFHRSEVKAA